MAHVAENVDSSNLYDAMGHGISNHGIDMIISKFITLAPVAPFTNMV